MARERLIVALIPLTLCLGMGCTQMLADTANESLDSAFPDGKWDSISLSEIVGSEGEFKDELMKLHLENGGHNEVVVERIDSSFVYGWSQLSGQQPKHLTKVNLSKVVKAEIWVTSAEQFESSHWLLVPFALIIGIIGVAVAAAVSF